MPKKQKQFALHIVPKRSAKIRRASASAPKAQHKLTWIFAAGSLVVATALALTWNWHTNYQKRAASIAKPSAKPFTQPKSLAELLALPPEQLDKVDFGLMNLLCAEGLSGSGNLDVDRYLRLLDIWAYHVERETSRNQHLFDEHPEKFKNSLAYYRMAMLATVLVQDLQIQYNPEREKQLEDGHTLRSSDEEKKFFADSRDLFIHGLLDGTHYGTCASMPFLYVAIGRRLGYPVTIATTASHFYVRYEEGNGKHFNVEATEHRAFLTPSDDEYKNPWDLHVSDEEINGLGELRPLSNKEILGHMLLTRSWVLRSMGRQDKQAETWATAARYLPDTPLWREYIHDMQQFARLEGGQDRRNALWDEVSQLYVLPGPGYAYFQDQKVRLHFFITYCMDVGAIEKAIHDFKKELGRYDGQALEPGAAQLPSLNPQPQQRLVLRYMSVTGKEVDIPADFLLPFEWRKIPPEVMDRIAAQKLDEEGPVLEELWKYYDELTQARQKAALARVRQTGAGPTLIARERVPREYWDSIPVELQMRLSGIKDEQDIVNEMWAFHAEQEAERRGEEENQKAILMHKYGVQFGQESQVNVPSYLLPPEYRDSMPLELKLRLAGKQGEDQIRSEVARYQQDTRNRENAERAIKLLQSAGPTMVPIQLVPASALSGGSSSPANLPTSPLTPGQVYRINHGGVP